MSRKECFIRDFKISQHFSANPNFREGVRALLVDKTMDAKWTPATIDEVNPKDVDAVFVSRDPKTDLQL